ncbi:GntR family transcriptional regulator [Paraburkholderia nodosa]|uniref:GntR family transcriptional regulator n=1 Tax=Paraburkholderia nodosa TaxID=392320 RepID=UPI00210C328A|nr:GntR family transcriptional regulator [Paraburkholderia nodosa]
MIGRFHIAHSTEAELDIQPSQSLHESVREELRRRIASGAYSLSPIPSTAMLSEEFGVSSITVKRALRGLFKRTEN